MTFSYPVDDEIELRPLDEDDAGELFAIIDGERPRLREWLPWVDRTGSPEPLREFIRGARLEYEAGRALHASIRYRGRIAGGAGYRAIHPDDRNTSIGYWLAARAEGKGVVTRVVTALLDHLFDEREVHRVEIRCGTGNTRSCAVPERLGFTREGVARQAEWVSGRFVDLVVWSMLAPEWKARSTRA